jgi:hypothetical protein
LAIIEQNEIHTDIIDGIRRNVTNFVDSLYFDVSIKIDDMKILEIQA